MRKYYDTGAEQSGGSALIIKEIKEQSEGYKKALGDTEGKLEKSIKDTETRLQDEISNAKGVAQKSLEKAEDLEKKMNTAGMGGQGGFSKSYAQEVEEKLNGAKEKLAKGERFSIELGTKAVGNMSSTTNLTGSYFVAPQVVPGVINQPYNEVHMRNLLLTGTTTSPVIRYVRDNGGEGGPAMVAEAGTKPQMDRDLQIYDANVRKIATYLRVPEEMIEDISYITSFLTEVGTEEVLAVEDTQILYGDGTGQNLSGLFTNATAWADPGLVASANRFDVLRAARLQLKKAKRNANFAIVSPLDYYLMTSAKDTTGNYILQGGGNGLLPSIDGVPIIEMNQVADNDFLVGDRRSAQIFFRANITVRFYEQDQDNAIKNLVTIVIEERLALPIYYTTGLVKGTFTAAITALGT